MYQRIPSKNNLSSFITTTELQNELLNIMGPFAPYNSLLYSLQVGQGKTYAAASLAYQYSIQGFYVLYASHTIAGTTNFKKECTSFVNDQRINDMNFDDIDCFTFSKLYNYINKNKLVKKYGLIILDEAHNLRDKKVRYSSIRKYIQFMTDSKLLLITATPMINEASEYDILTSFVNFNKFTEDKIYTIYSNEPSSCVKIEYQGINTPIGDLYITEMKGKQKDQYLSNIGDNYNTFNSNLRQMSICTFSNDAESSISGFKDHSCKFDAIMNSLKEGELSIVFSFFKEKAAVLFALYLENSGLFTKYNRNDEDIVSDDDLSFLSDAELDFVNKMKNLNLKDDKVKRKYALITGSMPSNVNDEIINVYSSLENKNGKIIELLIGTSVICESISLRELRHVHILHPFWNYGVINQMIGRALRLNSYKNPENTVLKIYLHAAIICLNGLKFKDALTQIKNMDYKNIVSDDIATWTIAWNKTISINKRLDYITETNKNDIIRNSFKNEDDRSIKSELAENVDNCDNVDSIVHPTVDDKLVLYSIIDNSVYDLRECFEKSTNSISRLKFMKEKGVQYNLTTNKRIYASVPTDLVLFKPPEGISIWVSCVDGQERISINNGIKDKRQVKRGKVFNNMTQTEIKSVSKTLGTDSSLKAIRSKVVELNRYYSKQVYIKDDIDY